MFSGKRLCAWGAVAMGAIIVISGIVVALPGPRKHPHTPMTPNSSTPAAMPISTRVKTANMLMADDRHYLGELTKGEQLVGTSGYSAWYRAITKDMRDQIDFTTAKGDLAAFGEPTGQIEKWRRDNATGVEEIWRFASAGLSGSLDTQAHSDAAAALTDLGKADKDAEAIAHH